MTVNDSLRLAAGSSRWDAAGAATTSDTHRRRASTTLASRADR